MALPGRNSRTRVGGFLHDFREFALRGNVVDLAVAVIIGGAFGAIISSFVADILMPAVINPFLSQAGTDWREATIGPGIRIGSFLGTVVDFIIIAFVLFLVIQFFERLKRQEEVEAAPAELTVEEKLNVTLERLTQAIESRQIP
ncbi:MAG: large conductance mechanosensitive channel protein MscL [Leptolyngbyaceae cyanobacterium SM1_1_3]|nr:large conductance mechanosensitive channel protein MscL [Leptolyngbyaceae cyanobacterium SM1_1_3]NJN01135.1 large conductance mechanosensitive channel protein MscL [Leptolyngbyaceae cyanobacterium RM1_1_2]NJO10032.1 large conductance mechanosensitive channel protein MscL [Leptolyngbyaceae cyanobacterium SL_1_1]